MLKKILQKFSLIYVLLWIFLVVWWYYYFYEKDSSKSALMPTSTIEIVSTWSLIKTIDVVWTAKLVDEQSLSFNQAWTITKVYFKAWDSIKKGDIIAELDNINWENSVKQAKLSLEDAKITLQQLYDSPDESQILQSKKIIESTKNSIEIAKEELQILSQTQTNSLNSQENEIENARKELELTIKEQENSLSNTTSNKSTTIKQIENSFTSDLTSISKIIEQLDYILWVTDTNKSKNDNYEMYLWAKNSTYKTQSESSLIKSISSYNWLKILVDSYDYSWDAIKIQGILTEYKKVYDFLENSTDLTYKTLENTISSSNFSETDIESKKSTIYNYLTTVQSKQNSITTSINSLNTLTDTDLIFSSNEISIKSKENNIEKLEKDLETTKKTYETNLKNKENSLVELQTTLEINKESYNELIQWPTTENIQKAKNNITQAELKLENALQALDDYKLEAPFDWVIRKIDYKVWDNLNNDTNKSAYIENPNLLQITVMLDQVDIAKVKIWTKARITFDAYATQKVSAVISSIDTTPTQSSWVTSYEVTLILDDENFNKTILSWMTWDVEIIVKEVENALIVSTSAILSENNKSYLTVMKNGKTQKVEVVIWMTSSWNIEIVSWVSLWDKIVIKTYKNPNASQSKTPTSLFPTWSSRNSSNRNSGFSWPPGWF